MYTINKEFAFSASHQLLGLPDGHPCARLHGHNYTVQVELQASELNAYGFVRDYRELVAFKDYLEEEIDHRHLNDLFGDDSVTAEKLARRFFTWCKDRWPEVSAVRVSETPKTWAEYRP
ncbi:MAG: 6-pyruvoyl tetrahydropterin synthase family protein [Desulforhopalus sp.]|nr:6-pyruvoyl tetrahydropterin synthase family protein [Desulforhopalus sp.]